MIPIFTSEEMRSRDKAGILEYGIPGMVLMENAARGAVDVAEIEFASVNGRRILIICGKGNNGGDGFAMARHFVNRGAEVDVLSIVADDSISGDARANLAVLRKMEKFTGRLRVQLYSGRNQLLEKLGVSPAFVVDAILGTGLSSPVSGEILEIIEILNDSSIPVLSIDLPSGINADTGAIMGSAISAKCTATMASYKRGLLLGKGPEYSGAIHIVDIGLPVEAVIEKDVTTFQPEYQDIVAMLPHRPLDAHKYQCGNVFVLAGSTGLTGAAVLSSQAALRSGAGIVHLGVPISLNPIFETKLTEVMTIPYQETVEGSFSLKDYERILERINSARITVLGPGISRNFETQNLLRRIVEHADAPLLLDADALYAISGHLDLLQKSNAEIILTPHAGEFARLVSQSKNEIDAKRISLAQTFAVEFGVTLVLKGAPTVIATRDEQIFINPTGNPGMATAGSGDVLSGIIAGLQAQGCTSEQASIAGVYFHGLAGDSAGKRIGEHGLIATDLISSFVQIMKRAFLR